jgi:hypothetical protein
LLAVLLPAASASAESSSRPPIVRVALRLAESPKLKHAPAAFQDCFSARDGARRASPSATRQSRRTGAPGAVSDDRDFPRGPHGRQCARLPLSEGSSPGDASEAAPLVRSIQEFVASGGGRPSGRRRRSAVSPGRTGSRGRVGGRGWWRSVAAASGPVRCTPVFLGCKPPIRLLLVGQTSYLWSAGDTAFPPRATVLLRRPTPLVSRGRTDAVPLSAEAWEPSAFISHHRIDRSSAQQALTLRPKLRTIEPRRSRKLSAGTSTRSRWPPTTATWSLPIGAEGRGTRA